MLLLSAAGATFLMVACLAGATPRRGTDLKTPPEVSKFGIVLGDEAATNDDERFAAAARLQSLLKRLLPAAAAKFTAANSSSSSFPLSIVESAAVDCPQLAVGMAAASALLPTAIHQANGTLDVGPGMESYAPRKLSSCSVGKVSLVLVKTDDDPAALQVTLPSKIPAWTALPYNAIGSVNSTMAYNMPVVQNTGVVKIYNGSVEMGVYAHQPMISVHNGYFLASWINAAHQVWPKKEDQPGMRVLWSYATVDDPLSYSTPRVLFPNMSSGACDPQGTNDPSTPPCAQLNSEPTVVLNDHVYFAASTRQFCLWPLDPLDGEGKFLLLRRVTLISSSTPELGQIFWARDPGAAWHEMNRRLGIRTLTEMDASTRVDIEALLAGARPCEPNATKCEFCDKGCQDIRSAGRSNASCQIANIHSDMDVAPTYRERTHWTVPHTQEDVIVYRSTGTTLCFSTRVEGNWGAPRKSKLADIHSNMNAGTLPDGRVYLLHNPVWGTPPPGTERDPLVLSLSSDGFSFNVAFVALSCRLPPVSPTKVSCANAVECPHSGCHPRNHVGGAAPGPQYPQGLVYEQQLFVIMSMNKEDIYVERIPISALGRPPRGVHAQQESGAVPDQ